MERNILKGKVWALVLGLLLGGCVKEEVDNFNAVDNGTVNVLLRPDLIEQVIVRSLSGKVEENKLQNVWVIQLDENGNVVTNDGEKLIQQYLYSISGGKDKIKPAEDGWGGSITMRVDPTTTEICFIANTSVTFSDVATKSDIENKSKTISNEESLMYNEGSTNYLPMAGSWTPQAGSSNEVKLLCAVAKLDLTLTFAPQTKGDAFALSSIQIKQVANVLQYFRDPVTLETGTYPTLEATTEYTAILYDGSENSQPGGVDLKTQWETQYMPSGSNTCKGKVIGETTFENFIWYLPENARGKGEAQNQWEKNAQTAPKDQAQYCTYLEIKGFYLTNGLVEEVVYHVYLGANNSNDFNLLRSRHYIMTATIKDKKLIDTRINEHTPKNYYDYTDNNSAWLLVGRESEPQKDWNSGDLKCPSGWRVPTKEELMLTWVYLSKNHDLGATHWTADGEENGGITTGRWSVNLGLGETLYMTESSSQSLRCVKNWTPDDGQKYPYVKDENIIISRENGRGVKEEYIRTEGDWSEGVPHHTEQDKENSVFTKLEIAPRATDPAYTDRQTWEKAAEYCKNLEVDGKKDWRMPTQRELMLMYLLNKELGSKYQLLSSTDDHINPDPNSDEYHVFYWSATQDNTVESSKNTVWSVCFCTDKASLTGKTEGYDKEKVNYVRCVRDVK